MQPVEEVLPPKLLAFGGMGRYNTGMTTYSVRLPVYEGPLDVLLALIEKRQLEITTVSLAAIADQFLDYARDLDTVDVQTLSQFINVSARLLLLKSRALLPAPPRAQEEPQEDDAAALVEQLREYRRFKLAAGWLRGRDEANMHAYLRPPLNAEMRARALSPGRSNEPVSVLLTALRRSLSIRLPELPPVEQVQPRTVTLAECIAALEELLVAQEQIRLSEVMGQAQSRVAIVVTFLAMLELIKRNRITVSQERPFDDVFVWRAG